MDDKYNSFQSLNSGLGQPLQGQEGEGGRGEEAPEVEGREGGQKGGVQDEDGEGAPGSGEGEVRGGDGATPLDPEGGEECVIQAIAMFFFCIMRQT